MTTLTLIEAIKTIGYDNNWAIYAEKIDGEFRADSPARFGQRQFDNGGVIDDAEYFANGERIGDLMAEGEDGFEAETASWIIDQLNEQLA